MSSKDEDLVVYGSGLLWDPPKGNIGKYMLDSMKKYGSRVTLVCIIYTSIPSISYAP